MSYHTDLDYYNIHISVSKYFMYCRKMSWKEAEQSCTSQKQRLMAPHDSIDEFLFFEEALQNIGNGRGVSMGDVTFIGISNEATVSNSSAFLSKPSTYSQQDNLHMFCINYSVGHKH